MVVHDVEDYQGNVGNSAEVENTLLLKDLSHCDAEKNGEYFDYRNKCDESWQQLSLFAVAFDHGDQNTDNQDADSENWTNSWELDLIDANGLVVIWEVALILALRLTFAIF